NKPFCDYCKRPRHTKEKCYKLHGYPQSFSQNQNPNTNQNQTSNFNQNPRQSFNYNHNSNSNQNNSVSLTQEEYNQLVSLLQQFKSGGGRDCTTSANIASGAANFAAIIACTSSIDFGKMSCECFENKADSWIIDSGVSNNMTFNKSLLTNIIALPYPLLVVLPNGYKVKVTEVDSVMLTPKITLDKVMFVPLFRYNLISVHSLASHLNCLV
ncbi:hypothetical protein A4A49_61655, partial [Nicotiana attenuata]